jgi:hypothetical protein
MVPARTNRSGDTRDGADRAFVTGGPADSVTGSVGRLDHLEDLALAGWPAHLKERRSGSRRTVEGYARMLWPFLGGFGSPAEVTPAHVLAWAHGIGLSLRAAGLPPSGLHILRHSAAKLRRDAGASIEAVSNFLDHSSPTALASFGVAAALVLVEAQGWLENELLIVGYWIPAWAAVMFIDWRRHPALEVAAPRASFRALPAGRNALLALVLGAAAARTVRGPGAIRRSGRECARRGGSRLRG